jgi:hypothetical protein
MSGFVKGDGDGWQTYSRHFEARCSGGRPDCLRQLAGFGQLVAQRAMTSLLLRDAS